MMRARYFISITILVFGISVAAVLVRRALADASPQVTNVTIADVGATSTTVTWTTNVKTDSFVDFSQDTNYCGVRNSGDFTTAHTLVIPNLDPLTAYFFRIRATDAMSNQSFSGDYTFTTTSSLALPNLNKITNPQQQSLAAKAISAIQQVTNPQALSAVAQAVNTQAQANVGPPKILGNPQIDIGTDQATITWNTDQDADGSVYIASEAEYNQNPAVPYPRKETDTNPNGQAHTVTLLGLTPSTTYHYKVSSQGSLGSAGESADLTFETKSLLPSILNPHMSKVEEHDATVSWGTPFPTAGTVTFTNESTRKSLSVGDPALVVTHSVQLTNLVFQTRYAAVITAQNQAGDTVTSQPIYFITTKDVVPPVISQVNNDSTLYPGQDTTVQSIISWQTDEPASCNLSYVSGIVKNSADIVSSTPETGLLLKHVSVITNFSPATVYKYWITCADADNNTTSSEDFVLLTPEQQKSIIDIILQNFQGTFGWLGGATGAKK